MNGNGSYVLVGRTDHDSFVKFPFHWATEIVDEIKNLDFNLIDLQSENFIENNVSKLISKYNPFFVFLNGHGAEWCIEGHNDEPVIQANKNDFLFKGKIVYSLACHTAICLGQISVDRGCKCYIGYQDNFAFVFQDPDNPSEDKLANIFKEASNQIPLTILKTNDPKQAYENSQKVFDEWIEHWWRRWQGIIKTSLNPRIVSEILAALLNDKECQVMISKG